MDINYNNGELIESDGNNPFLIDDPLYCWIVMENRVNLYGVYLKDGTVSGTRKYICTVEKGGAFFGFNSDEYFGFLAVGQTDTKVLKSKISDIKDELPVYMDRWIDDITKDLSGVVKRVRVVKNDEETDIAAGETILSSGPVMWVRNLKGSFVFLGRDDFSPVKEDSFFPLSKNLWWIAENDAEIKSFTTKQYIAEDGELGYFKNFQQKILDFIKIKLIEGYIDEKEGLERKELTDIAVFSEAVSGLAYTMEEHKTTYLSKTAEDILFRTCQIIGKHMGINFEKPLWKSKKINDPVTEISRVSKIRHRKLNFKKNWWKEDNGPLLGFLKENNQPVALLPVSSTSYDMIDSFKNVKQRVTEETASTIHTSGYMFYPPFPPGPLNLWDILTFGLKYCKSDLLKFLFISVIAGLLGMVVPVITGIIFNDIIPGGERREIWILSLSLFVTSLSVAIFQILQSIFLIRIDGKMNSAIQSAIWDRIMLLPCSFFRKFSSGDLASRSLGFDAICRELFTGLTLPSILSFIYALFSFPLLFYYSKGLAVIASIIGLIVFTVIILTGYMQLSTFRKLYTIQGHISGFVFQLINGITKLKVAGAEARAFAQWAEKFSLQKRLAFKIQIIKNFYGTFNSIILLISSIIIFLFLYRDIFKEAGTVPLSSGDFLAFNAAFTGFMMSVMQLGMTISSLTTIVPTVERLQPLIETLPEVDNKKSDPGEISGEIEVSHVSFRYKKEGDLILRDINFSVKPGEFIAFVGASGAGKSTIIRLLLGFEIPEQGSIYYDGKNIKDLDLISVRNQTGVVLQNSTLMSGELYYNIIGSSILTLDDAWEAARVAGLEEDIKAMPMGMHTVVSEGGETFSGGQKQRILIARAVARKPKIILFDEATSALDNKTQAVVTENLERLEATRVVIAHRISTIAKANRIYVVEKGSVVQSGTYEELMGIEGPFKELAMRQIV